MQRVFNLGLGMIMICSAVSAGKICTQLRKSDLPCWPVGRIERGTGLAKIEK